MTGMFGRSEIGTSKHRKSGEVVTHTHFTGKKGGKRVRRKGKRGLTRKQRRLIKGSHVSQF